MTTYITTKTYHEVRKNGKIVNKKALDATYDGYSAIIDTLDNNRAHRFELTKGDIKSLLTKVNNNNLNLESLINHPSNERKKAKTARRKKAKTARRKKAARRRATRANKLRRRNNN